MTLRMAINGGHGPNTPGKRTPDGVKEFEFNFPTAQYLEQYLKEYTDVQTLFIPEPDRDVPLTERTNRANAWGADVWLSVHYNAFGDAWNSANGIETWVYTTRPTESTNLALKVQAALIEATGRTDRGVKAGNLHELRETNMPAILCECGFMTNKTEAATMKDTAFQKKIARAIADGVAAHFGLEKGNSNPTTPTSPGGSSVPYPGHLIKRGSRGIDVERIQRALNNALNRKIVDVDGIFGELTAKAVGDYQRRHGLQADKIVGPQTWGVMF